MMKTLAVCALVLSLGLTAAFDAEAKRRLGGGKSSGMQRDAVTAPARPGTPATSPGAGNNATPAQQPGAAAAAPAAGAAATAAAAQQRRSWMGPIAGLAAGLGLMALASHFGFGEALANAMMIGLLVMAVLLVLGFILRRRAAAGGTGNPTMAGAGAVGGTGMHRMGMPPADPAARSPLGGGGRSLIGSALGRSTIGGALAGGTAAATLPAGFDAEGFARNAKQNFLGLQAANDSRDLDRLRDYLTPEMFEEVRAELASTPAEPQTTEVFGLQAQVLAVAEEADRYIVSVHFTGGIRHAAGAEPEDLSEIWHLVKPRTGQGGWMVAGIQQA